ncbi:MAG: nitrogen fixation protein NifQ, partial [bacterium]|nr:nitrogen fixation protein NifQ [bacterium]
MDMMVFAHDKGDLAAIAFAGVISAGYGEIPFIPPLESALGAEDMHGLLGCYFPDVERASLPLPGGRAGGKLGTFRVGEELDDLIQLLDDHASVRDKETRWMARAVAIACMGSRHLWQDMGLPDRNFLSALLSRYFGPLAEKNTKDMKWKKFFYRELCAREGLALCKSPNCEACVDYSLCFSTADSAGGESSPAAVSEAAKPSN